MRVLQINSVCGIRSTGRICTDIAQVLEKAGHECKIAYGRENVPQKHQKYAVRIGNELGIRIDGLKTRLLDNAGFNSRTSTRIFIQWAKAYNPDVVHLHNIHGYYINIEQLFGFLKELDKPVIWTLHDCWAFTGHCSYFDIVGCEKWKTECSSCPLRKEYPASFGYDRSQKNYLEKKHLFTGIKDMTIVTPSQWLASLVKQSFLGEYPVKVIHNGIDTKTFTKKTSLFREEYGLQKRIVLGVSAVWDERKGLDDLVKLSDMLGNEYQIVIVGVSQKQKESLPDNIIGITRTNDAQQLAQIYTAADVFVNPTYQDNYPTVNLEAQACGTPVITYKSGGSPESVPNGQVVEKGDLEGLCDAVKNLDKCSVLQCDFRAETAFAKYLDLYTEKCPEHSNSVLIDK